MKNKRGGARLGAGRPKEKPDTVVIRVPVVVVDKIKQLIQDYYSESQTHNPEEKL